MIDVTQQTSAEADGVTAVYAIGDIHGRLDLLNQMEAAIAADISTTRPARPLICYLGDYVDRGPHSAQVIDRLCAAGRDGVARVFLKGNHEDRMIDFLSAPADKGPAWMMFGGREALESYGVAVPENLDDTDWEALRDRFDAVLPKSHRAFLSGLAIAFRWEGYLMVHAGLDPQLPATAQRSHDLMWIREPFISSQRDWGFTVVHGHVIVDEPVFRANRIGIDTGAYHSGRLTCLVLTQDDTRIIQVAQ
ncbi:MAG TPA: metallophosphoesterase family protein [Sphingobium sp.]|nr:metallophosphoesterase family protein [Sphingobium sp.]